MSIYYKPTRRGSIGNKTWPGPQPTPTPTPKPTQGYDSNNDSVTAVPFVAFSIPLLVRILELVKEGHVCPYSLLEKLMELGLNDLLDMDSYDHIVADDRSEP